MEKILFDKTLHVSPEPPGDNSGGQLCVHQSAEMLFSVSKETVYIGKEISKQSFADKYDKHYYLEPSTNILSLVRTVFSGQNNKRYLSWKKWLKGNNLSDFDLLYLDFTKLDYVVKDVKNSNKKALVVVRAHNVEYDFAKNDLRTKWTFSKFLNLIFAKKHEKYIYRNADIFIALTKEDACRFEQLYGKRKNGIEIIPVCLDNQLISVGKEKELVISKKALNVKLLLTGSLWYGANLEGITWFVKNVVPLIDVPVEIKIAGSNPSSEFIHFCSFYNIEVVASPERMEPFILWSDLIVVPIFSGAGMKVKICEALSYGKPVVTTRYGAIGYDICSGMNSFIANESNDFASAIKRFYYMSSMERKKMCDNAYSLYEDLYSTEKCMKDFALIFRK